MWWLIIAAVGLAGYVEALNTQAPGEPLLDQMERAGRFLSQIGSLVVGLFYLGLALYPWFKLGRRLEPPTPWLRGQLTILMLLIAIPYNTIMGGSLDSTWELLEHAVLPALVILDWIFVGRGQAEVRWWHPFSWLAFPVVYLYNIVVYDAPNYTMFVPGNDDFTIRVVAAMGFMVVVGYVLLGIGRGVGAIKRSISATDRT